MLKYRYRAYQQGIKKQTVIGLLINKVEFGLDIHAELHL